MKREELITKIASDASITKKQAGMALTSLLNGVSGALKKGDKVTFVGFGTFAVSKRKKRMGVNPQTRQKITIPARKVPVFKAGSKLKLTVK
ncbi:MAG: HU family DNA-binding protein [Candidatus Cloacimonetes bacterium]|nr:HU family DNA-binding protein [Candidatus Cloacimonadota bacterium]